MVLAAMKARGIPGVLVNYARSFSFFLVEAFNCRL